MTPSKVLSNRWMVLEVSILGVLLGGCLQPAVPPAEPASPVARRVETVMSDYASQLADSFDAVAGELQSNGERSAAEINAELQSRNAAARREAFRPLDQLLDEEIGGERWHAGRAAELFKDIAQGLRSLP